MPSQKMNALVFEKPGSPETVLSYKSIDIPVPKNNEVIIKIEASPINPSDFMFINGTYRFQPQYPQVAGMEATGTITSVPGESEFKIGTRVSFFSKGTWAEYVSVDCGKLIVIPDGLAVEKAAQLPLNAMTAWGLMESADIPSGGWILLTAGNSSVSKLIMQFAAYRKINVIAAVRNKGCHHELRQYTPHIVDISSQEIIKEITEITDGKGLNAVIDPVGGPEITPIVKSIIANGRIIIYGSLSHQPTSFDNADFVYKNILVRGFGILSYYQSKSPEQLKQISKELVKIMSHDKFKMDVADSHPLIQFGKALEQVGSGTSGKILFVP